jgi:hypothetical protein
LSWSAAARAAAACSTSIFQLALEETAGKPRKKRQGYSVFPELLELFQGI